MKKVTRDELLGLGAYEQIRDRFRARVIEEKKARRFFPGPEMSVVFESHDTALFQIQEMLRTERISAEAGILHELETYNELVPGDGELSFTLFIEIADRDTRERRLGELAGLERAVAVEIGGKRFQAHEDLRGELTDRTTAVHYMKVALGSERLGEATDVTFVIDHPKLQARTRIPVEVVRALAADQAG